MADKLKFELVSPERVLASLEADMVVVPGGEGHFGVQPEHAPFMSTVRPGVIDVHDGGRITERIFVEGGFAEVNPEGLIVLAEAAVPLGELDAEEARRRLQNAREDLTENGVDSIARTRLERLVAISQGRT